MPQPAESPGRNPDAPLFALLEARDTLIRVLNDPDSNLSDFAVAALNDRITAIEREAMVYPIKTMAGLAAFGLARGHVTIFGPNDPLDRDTVVTKPVR